VHVKSRRVDRQGLSNWLAALCCRPHGWR